jgi:hypothetical protein
MSHIVTGNGAPSDQGYDAISPYLRQPLRSLKEYLRERAQSRKEPQETTPTRPDDRKEQDDPSSEKGGQGDQ